MHMHACYLHALMWLSAATVNDKNKRVLPLASNGHSLKWSECVNKAIANYVLLLTTLFIYMHYIH